MKILYIEDHERLSLLVCNFLEKNGFEVERFALGKKGLERFYQEPEAWDVVIIDLELPDVRGETIIAKISAQRAHLPIVVWSGAANLKNRVELYSAGAASLLPKPTGAQEVLDVLKGLIATPLTSID